jgi:hypothetical protein
MVTGWFNYIISEHPNMAETTLFNSTCLFLLILLYYRVLITGDRMHLQVSTKCCPKPIKDMLAIMEQARDDTCQIVKENVTFAEVKEVEEISERLCGLR